MNELLQRHGCSTVFNIPEGLKELMSDITREVLREQPAKLYEFIANYLSVLLITREHGILAVRILDDLCDCQPSVSEHLLQIGLERSDAESMSKVIKEEVEGVEALEGQEKLREAQIVKKLLQRLSLDEEMTAKVCQVARNAYKDYWYRKKLLQKSLSVEPEEPWEIAAQHTLELYKKTKPSLTELTRATERIQAAYRGYHIRKNLLEHLKPKPKVPKGPKLELPGPPLDIAESREIDLGPIVSVKIKEDDVAAMFDADAKDNLGLKYDPLKMVTHVEGDEGYLEEVDMALNTPHTSTVRQSEIPKGVISKILADISRGPSVGFIETKSVSKTSPDIERRDSELPETPKGDSIQKMISFAVAPTEIIPEDIPETTEAPEGAAEAPIGETGEPLGETEAPVGDTEAPVGETEAPQEIPEEIEVPAEQTAEDVPEQIPDQVPEVFEGDPEGALEVIEDVADAPESGAEVASEPASAPEDGGDATDVEQGGDATTTEDEGEE